MNDRDKPKDQLIEELGDLRARVRELESEPEATTFSDASFHDPYRTLVKSIQYGLWAIDRKGDTIYLNRKMASLLGHRVADMLGRSIHDFLHPEQPLEAGKIIQPLDASSTAQQDVRFQRSDGTALWALVTASPLIDSRGQPLGMLNLVSDISERKHTEQQMRQSSDLFRQFGDAVSDVVWITDWPDHRVSYVSPAYADLWGRSRERLLNDPGQWLEALHPDDRTRVEAAFNDRVEEGRYDEEYRVLHPDGTVRWIRDRGFPVRDPLGRVYRVAGIAEDITERKRLEKFRARQSEVLELLATGKPLVSVLEAVTRMMEDQVDGMLCSVLGLDDSGECLRHLAAPSLPDAYNRAVDGTRIGDAMGSCGTAAHRRERVIVEDIATDPLWTDFRELALEHGLQSSWSQPIFSVDGDVLGTFAMYYRVPRRPDDRDLELISAAAHLAGIAIERHRDLDALSSSARNLRQIIDLVPHMIFAKNSSGHMLLANQAVAEAYGATVEELVGRSQRELHESRGELSRMLSDDLEVIQSGQRKFVPEEEFTDFNGNVRILQTTKIPFTPSGSTGRAMLGVAIDITERKELERQISSYAENLDRFFLGAAPEDPSADAWFAKLFAAAPDFYLILDAGGNARAVNHTLTEALDWGHAELIGRDALEIVAPEFRDGFRNALRQQRRSGQIEPFECRLLHRDGTIVDSVGTGRVQRNQGGDLQGFRLILRNIGRRRSLRRRLARTEQLVTTGRLAASVAHEINNPLQALLLHLSIVGESLPPDFPDHRSWTRIEEGVARIQQVVNDLLDLHRVGRSRRERIDVNALVEEALRLSKSHIRAAGIEQTVELDASAPEVLGVSQHLYQVILNLVLNAVEAMNGDGILAVKTRGLEERVHIEIEDTGSGIHPDDLPNIFEPLFTGRRGHGTGLGLFVSYNLIKEHHGEIEIDSRLGEGTRMRIVLPRARIGNPRPS